jgi:hypothetical protein
MSWYKIKIFNKEVNWASVVASGVLFVGLELWRRKYIAEKIKKDIRVALAENQTTNTNQQVAEETKTLLEQILDRI